MSSDSVDEDKSGSQRSRSSDDMHRSSLVGGGGDGEDVGFDPHKVDTHGGNVDKVDSPSRRNIGSSDASPQTTGSPNGFQRRPFQDSLVSPPTEPPTTFNTSSNFVSSPLSKSNVVTTPTKSDLKFPSSPSRRCTTAGAVSPGAVSVSGKLPHSPLKQQRGRRSSGSGNGNEKAVAVGAVPAAGRPSPGKNDEGFLGLRLADAEDAPPGAVAASGKPATGKSDEGSRGQLRLAAAEDTAEANYGLRTVGADAFAPRKDGGATLGSVAIFNGGSSLIPTAEEKADRKISKMCQSNLSSTQGVWQGIVGSHSVHGTDHRPCTTSNAINGKTTSPPSKADQLHLATGHAAVAAARATSEEETSHNTTAPVAPMPSPPRRSAASTASSPRRPGARASFSRPHAYRRAHSPLRDTSSHYNDRRHQEQPDGSLTASDRPAEVADAAEVAYHLDEAEIRAMAAASEQPSSGKTNNLPIPFYKTKRWTIAAVILVTVAIVGAIVALTAGGRTSPPTSTPAPSPYVTSSPTMEPTQLLQLDPVKVAATELYIADQISNSTDLNKTGSPQNQAWLWLVSDDKTTAFSNNMTQYEVRRMLARYILAVFYFALSGDQWKSSSGWLDAVVDECAWEFVTCNETSDEVFVIQTNLTIGGNPLGGSNNMIGALPSELNHLSSLGKSELRYRLVAKGVC
jgi:hypothetical protein